MPDEIPVPDIPVPPVVAIPSTPVTVTDMAVHTAPKLTFSDVIISSVGFEKLMGVGVVIIMLTSMILSFLTLRAPGTTADSIGLVLDMYKYIAVFSIGVIGGVLTSKPPSKP